MFREFFKFELSYWLRGWMVYIFVAALAVLFGLAAGSDFVQVGGPAGNTHKNAPYMIALWYAASSVLTCFMAAAIYDSSASRDFSSKMSDILFSKPLSKWGFLCGRFFGATVIALIPAIGISIGILGARLFAGSESEQWGETAFAHHWMPFLIFVIPNTLLFGSIVFAVASVTRNTLYSFMALLLLLVVYAVTQSLTEWLEYENLAGLIDPFGSAPFGTATKYWTVSERNSLLIPITPLLIANRLIWLTVAFAIFAIAGHYFRFEIQSSGRRRKASSAPKEEEYNANLVLNQSAAIPKRQPAPSWWTQFASTLASDMRSVVGSTTFIVIMCFALLNTTVGLFLGNSGMYGGSSFPVTYNMVEQISGSLLVFPLAIITYFTGVLVWRDRDSRIHEILGATPTPNGVFTLSRLVTMLVILYAILLVGIAIGCFYQWVHGYTRYQLDVYFMEMIAITGTRLAFFAVVGFVAHTLAPNKYIGYVLFILFIVVNGQVWRWLRWETLLFRFGAMPGYVYSDMFGIQPYLPGLIGFGIYWICVSAVVLWLCSVLMHRGVARSWVTRLREGLTSIPPRGWILPSFAMVAAVLMGCYLAYNTMVLNTMIGSSEQERRQVEYEKTYQSVVSIPQPKILSVNYAIDIYPETRNMRMSAVQTIANRSDAPIDTLYVNVAPFLETTIEIPGAILDKDDTKLLMRTYRMEEPIEPGQTLEMKYTVTSNTRGIENSVSNAQLVQNGTFFNNGVAPAFGFSAERRVVLPRRRKAFGLPPIESFPELARECGDACKVHYIADDSDWVTVETVISTSADQTAVAPGTLVEKWSESGRNYFRYKVDHPSLNFYSFISAKYEVERGKVGDVDTEVYYHKDHPWNVSRMSEAIQETLAYCNAEFGPYKHKQARIIEFPRVAQFAQAFPGTMPYSESIGFIANLEKPDDIDMVSYVVAHEMGHQWWAHQVIGAKMQGATLLSESLAQYTALMIMRKKYGDDMMHKFFRFEMDRYLRSRGTEQLKERPLISVEPSQGYIHYQKGGLALYYLTEMIGEKRINAALKDIVDKYAYQGPPYPNSYALVDRLREQTPPELQYLIKDLFEDITLFGNRTLEATAEKTEDGKYRVKIKVHCEKFKADDRGEETSVEMNDFIEIGAFAKAESGKRYGKLLHRERVQLVGGVHELEFVVDELPHQAGIDPRNLLIDRVPADNLKTVTIKN